MGRRLGAVGANLVEDGVADAIGWVGLADTLE
jgi:hypothetical protein